MGFLEIARNSYRSFFWRLTKHSAVLYNVVRTTLANSSKQVRGENGVCRENLESLRLGIRAGFPAITVLVARFESERDGLRLDQIKILRCFMLLGGTLDVPTYYYKFIVKWTLITTLKRTNKSPDDSSRQFIIRSAQQAVGKYSKLPVVPRGEKIISFQSNSKFLKN